MACRDVDVLPGVCAEHKSTCMRYMQRVCGRATPHTQNRASLRRARVIVCCIMCMHMRMPAQSNYMTTVLVVLCTSTTSTGEV